MDLAILILEFDYLLTMKKPNQKVKLKVSSASTATMMLIAWVILFLIMVQFLMHVFRGESEFVAHELYGDTIVLSPAIEPNVTTSGLLRWASLAVTNAYTINFVEHEEQTKALREFFTKDGWKAFKSAHETSQVEEVIDKKLIVTSVVNAPPVVVDEYFQHKTNGVFSKDEKVQAWRVQIPLLVTYQGASESNLSKQKLVTLTILRDKNSEKGIAIDKFADANLSLL